MFTQDTIRIIATLTLIAGFILLAFFAFQPKYSFVIRISAAGVRLTRGNVSPSFLYEVDLIRTQFNLDRGWVRGIQRGSRFVLEFSGNLPPELQQRVRNLWAIHKK